MSDINKTEEINFQKQRAKSIKNIEKTPARLFKKYRNNRFHFLFIKEFLFKNLNDLNEKYVCDLGCGEGELSVLLAKLGAKVFAIDMSDDLIEIAKKQAELDGASDKIEFVVGDVEKFAWNDFKFDFVICYGVLHHINIAKTLPQIKDFLKDSGKFIFIEPINFLPNLQKIIKKVNLSTKKVSINEKPLTPEDIETIKKYFKFDKVKYFNFLGRITRIIHGSNLADYGNLPIKIILFVTYLLDYLISLIFPPFKKAYRVVAAVCRKSE